MPQSIKQNRVKQNWLSMDVPACVTSLSSLNVAVMEFAQRQGFAAAQQFLIQLALEELYTTILGLAFDEDDEHAVVGIRLEVKGGFLQLSLLSRGLPFSWAMIPDYDPQRLNQDMGAGSEGLSAFLLKQSVDRYRLLNLGKQGLRFELEWRMPLEHIAELESQTAQTASELPVMKLEPIRRLQDDEAIKVARLVYRSYGYSYVYDYMYYPERIVQRHQNGTLESWVIPSESGDIVGHIALMKAKPEDRAVEWGIAVVDPRCRGGGLMKQMVDKLMAQLQQGADPIAYAHAVTSHVYTQKTALKFDFFPTALQLCLAPNIKYKKLSEQNQQRESAFVVTKAIHPIQTEKLYPPIWLQNTLIALAEPLQNWPFATTESAQDSRITQRSALEQRREHHRQALSDVRYRHKQTQMSSEIYSVLDIASIHIEQIGADQAQVLAQELHRLRLEKVAVIHLYLNLTDPTVAAMVASAEELGFFACGLMPMMPWPYTLCLQYLNNIKLDYEQIVTEQPIFTDLKSWVQSEQALCEQLSLQKPLS